MVTVQPWKRDFGPFNHVQLLRPIDRITMKDKLPTRYTVCRTLNRLHMVEFSEIDFTLDVGRKRYIDGIAKRGKLDLDGNGQFAIRFAISSSKLQRITSIMLNEEEIGKLQCRFGLIHQNRLTCFQTLKGLTAGQYNFPGQLYFYRTQPLGTWNE